MLGAIVLTTYNNKTYRIDDVDFNANAQSTFKRRDQEISYMDYYRERYNITIRNPKMPMLVSRAKARDRRAGAPEFFYLIPELCRSTGKF